MARYTVVSEVPTQQPTMKDNIPNRRYTVVSEAPKEESALESLTGPTMAFMEGISHAGGQLGHGILQSILESGHLGENIKRRSQEVAKERVRKYLEAQKQYPSAAQAGNLVGDIGMTSPAFLLGGGAPLITRGAQLLKGIGASGLGGALTGGAQYVQPEESRMENALMGGLGGVLGGVGSAGIIKAGELTGKTINKLKNIKKGIYKPEYQAVMEASQKHGIDVLPGDIQTTGFLPKLSELSEKVPGINIIPARLKQMKQAEKATKDIYKKQHKQMISSEYGGPGGLERLKNVAKGDTKRSAKAKELLADITSSGEDWNKIIQTSGNVALFNKKLKADELSSRISELARPFGNVPEPHTISAVSNSLKELSEQRIPDKGTIKQLQEIQESLSKPQNYEQMNKFRSSIGNMINDYYQGKNSLIGSEGVSYLQRVKNAIEKDLDIFANTRSPELKQANKEFKRYYRKEVVPYKDKQLAKALTNADPDEVYNAFIKTSEFSEGKGHSRAQRFYNALDEKGREAVKTGMFQKALEKSFKKETEEFSPALFAAELKRNQPLRGKFFNEKEKKDIEGFTKLMKHIEKSGQTKARPTGEKAIPFILGTGSVLGTLYAPLIGTGILGSSYGLKKIMSSPGFAKFLAASSKSQKSPDINLSGAMKGKFKDKTKDLMKEPADMVGGE